MRLRRSASPGAPNRARRIAIRAAGRASACLLMSRIISGLACARSRSTTAWCVSCVSSEPRVKTSEPRPPRASGSKSTRTRQRHVGQRDRPHVLKPSARARSQQFRWMLTRHRHGSVVISSSGTGSRHMAQSPSSMAGCQLGAYTAAAGAGNLLGKANFIARSVTASSQQRHIDTHGLSRGRPSPRVCLGTTQASSYRISSMYILKTLKLSSTTRLRAEGRQHPRPNT